MVEAADFVLESFKRVLSCNRFTVQNVGTTVPIPTFSSSTVISLCEIAEERLKQSSTLLRIDGSKPVKLVGDIHGSLLDLVCVLDGYQNDDCRYLFLGDYVDRGQFSLEVILLLFALLVLRPNQFYLIRGNHEFKCICQTYGFYDEIVGTYLSDCVFNSFISAFNYLPIAAVVNNELFCVHGGISKKISHISQIENLVRPIDTYKNSVIRDLLWADPDETIPYFKYSDRGSGDNYGSMALTEFLNMNNCKTMVRGHQCVDGIQVLFDGKLITVFSASNYEDVFKNRCGIIIYANGSIEHQILGANKVVMRETAFFFKPNCIPLVRKSTFEGRRTRIVMADCKCTALMKVSKSPIKKVKLITGSLNSFTLLEMHRMDGSK